MSDLQSYTRVTETGESYVIWNEYYQSYRNWCIANGEKPWTRIRFTNEMKEIIEDWDSLYKDKKVDGKTVKVLFGQETRMPENF